MQNFFNEAVHRQMDKWTAQQLDRHTDQRKRKHYLLHLAEVIISIAQRTHQIADEALGK